MLKMVVFPAPFGPMRPLICPRSTSRSRSRTAVNPPNFLVSLRISSSAIGALRSRVGCALAQYRSNANPFVHLAFELGGAAPARHDPLRTEDHHHNEGGAEDHVPGFL